MYVKLNQSTNTELRFALLQKFLQQQRLLYSCAPAPRPTTNFDELGTPLLLMSKGPSMVVATDCKTKK